MVAGLLGVALLLRLPEPMAVPRLTDETNKVLLGLQIARGEVLPLVGVNTYIGALFNYLIAGAFHVLGPRPDVGLLTALTFGTLGIVPTYLLARRLGGSGWHGRAVGIVAGLLHAFSPTDILVTSRIGYSHSLTPCFTTFGLWLLHRAIVSRAGWSLALSGVAFGLALSGVAFGLALQTHLSALAMWPGLGLYLLGHRRAVRLRWLALAGLLGLAMIANIVAYNVVHVGATVEEILFRSGRYGGSPSTDLELRPLRLWTLLRSLAFALGGRVSEQVEPAGALLSPSVLVACILVLAGLVLLARRRDWLPFLVVVSALLVVSLLNDRVEPVIVRARHYALILPLGFVLSPNENNLAFLKVSQAISRGARTERVYVDRQLATQRTISGGRMYTQIQYLLFLHGQEFQQFDVTRQRLPAGGGGAASRRVVPSADSLEKAAARYRLVPIPGGPGDGAPVRVFRAFSRPEAGGTDDQGGRR